MLYINDILNLPVAKATTISYADDTALIFHGKTWRQVYRLAGDGLNRICCVLKQNILTLNASKSVIIPFCKTSVSKPPQNLFVKLHTCTTPSRSPPNQCKCTSLIRTNSIKYLGIVIDENLSFKAHVHQLSRVRKLIFVAKKLRTYTSGTIIRMVYHCLCQSIIEYDISVWGGAGQSTFIELERAQRAVIKVALKKPFNYSTDLLYKEFGVLRVRQLFILKAALLTHKSMKAAPYYESMVLKRTFRVPCPRANSLLAGRCPAYLHPHIYNKVNRHCNIYKKSNYCCRKLIKEWLLSLTYDETELIISK